MKIKILAFIMAFACIFAFTFGSACSCGDDSASGGSTVKITSSNFNAKVLNADKAVLIDFWADWCGPCKLIAPAVEAVAKERGDVLVGKVNVDENPSLASKYNVTSIPTLIVFKNGKVVKRSTGVKSKSQILAMLG